MDKISGILPSSPRIKAIDTTKSQPARPGAPSFGRAEGKNSLGAAKAAFSKEAQLAAAESELGSAPLTPDSKPYKKLTEADHAKIAQDISKRFFEGIKSDIHGDQSLSDEIAERFEEASGPTELP